MKIAIALVLLFPVIAHAHTAEEIDKLFESQTVTYGEAAWFILAVALDPAPEGPREAFIMARERGWIPARARDEDTATLGCLSLLMVYAFDLQGSGFMFRLTGSSRHAFRDMRDRGLVAGRHHPSLLVSGESFFRMLANAEAYAEGEW